MRIFFLLSILFVSTHCFAQQAKVIITITGFKSDKGKVMLALFNDTKGFPNQGNLAYKKVTGTIKNQTATIILENIPYGTYAIAVFHDENNNDKIDYNMVGYPTEKFGFSKNAKVVFAPPKWEEAKFSVQTSEVKETIALQ
jgi:uncharacterized protein (DUF2141 family)